MGKFVVNVEEKFMRDFIVIADTQEEAESKIENMCNNGKIVLDNDDFIERIFESSFLSLREAEELECELIE